MLKEKLNWRRPLFFALMPVFLVMAFLGFPLPVAPPPATRPAVEQVEVIKKKKKKDLTLLAAKGEAPEDAPAPP